MICRFGPRMIGIGAQLEQSTLFDFNQVGDTTIPAAQGLQSPIKSLDSFRNKVLSRTLQALLTELLDLVIPCYPVGLEHFLDILLKLLEVFLLLVSTRELRILPISSFSFGLGIETSDFVLMKQVFNGIFHFSFQHFDSPFCILEGFIIQVVSADSSLHLVEDFPQLPHPLLPILSLNHIDLNLMVSGIRPVIHQRHLLAQSLDVSRESLSIHLHLGHCPPVSLLRSMGGSSRSRV